MRYYIDVYSPLVIIGLTLAAPFLALAILWRSRKAGKAQAVAEVCSVAAAACVLIVCWQPGSTGGYPWPRQMEWVPFTDLTALHLDQILLNALLLIPFGVLASTFRLHSAWLLAFPVVIEAVQWALIPGRIGSTEDILLGWIGASAGAWVAARLTRSADFTELQQTAH